MLVNSNGYIMAAAGMDFDRDEIFEHMDLERFRGWLIYQHWNHLLMSLRYFVPVFLIMLYDCWELSYQKIEH